MKNSTFDAIIEELIAAVRLFENRIQILFEEYEVDMKKLEDISLEKEYFVSRLKIKDDEISRLREFREQLEVEYDKLAVNFDSVSEKYKL